jgi:predicted RNA-binding protein with EMAP domain
MKDFTDTEIHNQLEYDNVQRVQEKMEELIDVLNDWDCSLKLIDKLDESIDILFSAREKFDKQRLKDILKN